MRGGVSASDQLPGCGLDVRGSDGGVAAGSAVGVEPKGVWLRGLAVDWAETLRRPPAREPGSFPALAAEAGEDESGWVRIEFGRSDLADGRLRSRLARLGAGWWRHPGEPLTAVFPGSAEQQAVYRFLHNSKVADEDILQPHREALVERCRPASAVLLVQDTTTLNYTGLRESAAGWDRLGSVRAAHGVCSCMRRWRLPRDGGRWG